MLSKMTPLSEIVQELNKLSSFKQCTAIEYEGILCFNNIKCKNLCEKHYKRLKTTGTINLIKNKEKKCRFIDCNLIYRAKGYCLKHYKVYGIPKIKCSIDKCGNNSHAKTFCKKHYERLIKYGSPEGKSTYIPNINKNLETHNKKRYIAQRKNIKCIAPNCSHTFETSVIRKGLCKNHYYKWHKYGYY